MHFAFIKETICMEHGKCGGFNRKQVFSTFCKCSRRGKLEEITKEPLMVFTYILRINPGFDNTFLTSCCQRVTFKWTNQS